MSILSQLRQLGNFANNLLPSLSGDAINQLKSGIPPGYGSSEEVRAIVNDWLSRAFQQKYALMQLGMQGQNNEPQYTQPRGGTTIMNMADLAGGSGTGFLGASQAKQDFDARQNGTDAGAGYRGAGLPVAQEGDWRQQLSDMSEMESRTTNPMTPEGQQKAYLNWKQKGMNDYAGMLANTAARNGNWNFQKDIGNIQGKPINPDPANDPNSPLNYGFTSNTTGTTRTYSPTGGIPAATGTGGVAPVGMQTIYNPFTQKNRRMLYA